MYGFSSPDLLSTKRQIKELYGLVDLPQVYGFILIDEQFQLFTGKERSPWSPAFNDAMATTRYDMVLELALLAKLPPMKVRVGILFYADKGDGKRSMIPFDSMLSVQELLDKRHRNTLSLVH